MNLRKRLGVALASLSLVGGVALAAPPSASATTTNATWQTCNTKYLQGQTAQPTTFCVNWINSVNAQGNLVARPTQYRVTNPETSTNIFVTKEDIGRQSSSGNLIGYTDTANWTAFPLNTTAKTPSTGSYWVADPDYTTNSDGVQAFVNIWLALSGRPYEAITVYDTCAIC